MSGSKINNFSIGDSNIQSVMLTLDKAYKGLHQVSLTNYDNTAESQIAAGSVVENNGALYKFDSNESITGSPSNGTVYIRLVPSGDTITAEYTNTAPTWSDSKQGWYGTSTDANKRYLEFVLTKNSTSWLYKELLTNFSKNRMHSSGFASLSSVQNITATGITIIQFDSGDKLYRCSLGADYKLQLSESGLYSVHAAASVSGSTGAGANTWFLSSDSSNLYASNQYIDLLSILGPNRILCGSFNFNANDKIWLGINIPMDPVNVNINKAFLKINKIGE